MRQAFEGFFFVFTKQNEGNDRLAFLCEVDLGGKEVPPTWSEAVKMLRNNYANSVVISAFAEIMHYSLLIITAHGVT